MRKLGIPAALNEVASGNHSDRHYRHAAIRETDVDRNTHSKPLVAIYLGALRGLIDSHARTANHPKQTTRADVTWLASSKISVYIAPGNGRRSRITASAAVS